MFSYTFVIPHHNTPDLLTRCLNSIPLRKDIQIIVIDDNSREDLKPCINRENMQVIYIAQNQSKGAGHARNVGLAEAKGKWVLFADCDDFYENKFIDELDRVKSSDCDIVFFDAWYGYHADKNECDREVNEINMAINRYLAGPKTAFEVHRLCMSTNVPWNKMFRREFVNKIGCRFEEIPIANDAWFSIFSGFHSKSVEVINKRLYYYVWNVNSISHKVRPLEHYKLAMKSNTRRNILFFKLGLFDKLSIPGFNGKNVKRDFGLKAYYMLVLHKLFHDPTFLIGVSYILVKKIMRTTKDCFF